MKRYSQKYLNDNGNVVKRMWIKDGNTTMLFLKGMTEQSYKAFINAMNSALISLGSKPFPKNKFLITR